MLTINTRLLLITTHHASPLSCSFIRAKLFTLLLLSTRSAVINIRYINPWESSPNKTKQKVRAHHVLIFQPRHLCRAVAARTEEGCFSTAADVTRHYHSFRFSRIRAGDVIKTTTLLARLRVSVRVCKQIPPTGVVCRGCMRVTQ